MNAIPLVVLIVALLLVGVELGFVKAQLSVNFYDQTCPNVDAIVTGTITKLAEQSNVVPPSTLRLLVHDCFVEGCDGSILISSTATNLAERDAPDNQNFPQAPFDAIVEAKKAVEVVCPGVVSCADILAMSARDAVVFTGGPFWNVSKGRRDGLVSNAFRVAGRLPQASFDTRLLADNFAQVNLTVPDIVVLSGGHTIGVSHCNQFTDRLYNFSSFQQTDPSMDPSFVRTLKTQCPQVGKIPSTVQLFDVTTPFVFDNAYFKNLQQGLGLLFSDQVLFNDPFTRQFVNQLIASEEVFFQAFVDAMIKMTSIGVKTGTDGEIRRDCTAFNPPTVFKDHS
ncbi:hypothetical protein O6H91_11G112100 [Diphasiastrum complanatum]|uniref:Uncharacterized protein n=1 Tax=Diphasiastrum complanatum TaxID=34168 RepID=A0ACC2CCV5_DIPCM|nr:hypothetical protein O6H91_11G112100 [Diphasiastrum complanatum]